MRSMESVLLVLVLAHAAAALSTVRARDLGILLDGTPGPLNAITHVAGIEVGHTTLIEGSGRFVPGSDPVRTGSRRKHRFDLEKPQGEVRATGEATS